MICGARRPRPSCAASETSHVRHWTVSISGSNRRHVRIERRLDRGLPVRLAGPANDLLGRVVLGPLRDCGLCLDHAADHGGNAVHIDMLETAATRIGDKANRQDQVEERHYGAPSAVSGRLPRLGRAVTAGGKVGTLVLRRRPVNCVFVRNDETFYRWLQSVLYFTDVARTRMIASVTTPKPRSSRDRQFVSSASSSQDCGAHEDATVAQPMSIAAGDAGAAGLRWPPQEVEVMTKKWIKPSMCQVPAGMEISRYQSAEIARRK